MRKPSPISTSSPRAMTISAALRPARARRRASAAAPLFTTCAAAAAGTAASSAPTAPAPRGPRSPVARSSSTSHVPAATSSAARAASDSGARPRLVCSSTPVALRTGRSVVAVAGQRVEHGVDDVGRGQRALPHGLLGGDDRGLDPLAAQPGGGVGEPGVGEHRVGAGHTPARDPPSSPRSYGRRVRDMVRLRSPCPSAASRSSATAPVERASSPLTSSRRSCAR